jgi:hypothetical protein
MKVRASVLQGVILCNLLGLYQCFGGTCASSHHNFQVFCPKNGGKDPVEYVTPLLQIRKLLVQHLKLKIYLYMLFSSETILKYVIPQTMLRSLPFSPLLSIIHALIQML